MATLLVKETNHTSGQIVNYTGNELLIDMVKLEGFSTNSFHIRTGVMAGQKFLNDNGKDICSIDVDAEMRSDLNQFSRLEIYAKKAGAIKL